jgi:hypothetical protein
MVAGTLVAGTAVLVAWCGWVSGFHRSTPAAEVTWAVSLLTVMGVDVGLWRRRVRLARSGGRPIGPSPATVRHRPALAWLWPWLVLVSVVAVWEALGIATGPHRAHLTISALAQAFRPLDAATLAVWMLVGLAYGFARWGGPGRLSGDAGGPERTRPDRTGPPALSAAGPVAAGSGGPPAAVLLPDSRAAGVAFWVAVVLAAAALDRLARRSDGRIADGAQVLRWIAASPALNLAAVAAWAFAGYHLFAR